MEGAYSRVRTWVNVWVWGVFMAAAGAALWQCDASGVGKDTGKRGVGAGKPIGRAHV